MRIGRDLAYAGILDALGYKLDSLGAGFFSDLLSDVCNLFRDGNEEEEIRKVLPSYYLEYYHFCYEIPKNRYFSELDIFCNSREVNEQTKDINRELMDGVSNLGLDDSLIFLGKKITELESIKGTSKIMIKTPKTAKLIEKV